MPTNGSGGIIESEPLDGPYVPNEDVTLTARPKPGYAFLGWSGRPSGVDSTPTLTVRMNQDRSLTAHFASRTNKFTPLYDLSLATQTTPTGQTGGEVKGVGQGTLGLLTTPGSPGTYASGERVALTATPKQGYLFAGWSGSGCDDAQATCTVTMSEHRTVTASFAKAYTLTTEVRTLDVDGDEVTDGSAGGAIVGGGVYPANKKVTVTVQLFDGYRFVGWTGVDVAEAGASGAQGLPIFLSTEVTMTSDKTVTATFRKAHGLTVAATNGTVTCGEGSGTASNCHGTTKYYLKGTSITLTAAPDDSDTHEFSRWTVSTSGSGVGGAAETEYTANPLTITLGADTTVTAVFTAKATPTPSPTPEPTPTYKLTATAGSGGSIECRTGSVSGTIVSCTGTFDEDTVIKIIPTVSITHTFGSWTGCDSISSANVCTVTMTAAKTVTASFTARSTPTPTYKLDARAGSGGSVRCRTGGISGTIVSCTGTFDEDTIVTITASVSNTHTFGSWTGCDSISSANVCTVTMNAARTVRAAFTAKPPPPATYRLNASAGTGGSIKCRAGSAVSCTGRFNAGTVVTITASTNTGYDFGTWTGCDATSANVCTVTMTAARTVRATFTRTVVPPPTTHQLDARAGTGGRISCRVSTLTISCTRTFLPGAVVTITASPFSTHTFGSWMGCDSTSANVCTVTMNAAKTVRASFTRTVVPPPTTHQLDARAGTGGRITCRVGTLTVSCTRSFLTGAVVTITASPFSTHTFGSWTGCDSTSINVCTVTMNAAKTVRAIFTRKVVPPPTTYRLDARAGTGGSIACRAGRLTVSCTRTFVAGAVVTITASTNTGYDFSTWTGCDSTSGSTCTVTMNAAKTVRATFTRTVTTYRLTIGVTRLAGAFGSVSPGPGTYSYAAGRSVTITASAFDSKIRWGGDCSHRGARTTCTLTMNGPRNVSVTFSPRIGFQEEEDGVDGSATPAP